MRNRKYLENCERLIQKNLTKPLSQIKSIEQPQMFLVSIS